MASKLIFHTWNLTAEAAAAAQRSVWCGKERRKRGIPVRQADDHRFSLCSLDVVVAEFCACGKVGPGKRSMLRVIVWSYALQRASSKYVCVEGRTDPC